MKFKALVSEGKPAFAAVTLFCAGLAWTGWQEWGGREPTAGPLSMALRGAVYESRQTPKPSADSAKWNAPATQSDLEVAIDLFGPMAAPTWKKHEDTAMAQPAPENEKRPIPGFELIEVGHEPYRLQLAGYFGERGDYRAALRDAENGDVLAVKVGETIPERNFSLEEFEPQTPSPNADGTEPLMERAPAAVLHDMDLEELVTLEAGQPAFSNVPRARFRMSDGRSTSVHEGETIADDFQEFKVARIQLDPPEVVLMCADADPSANETTILRLAGRDQGEAGGNPAVWRSTGEAKTNPVVATIN